jgi:hypothetical protein
MRLVVVPFEQVIIFAVIFPDFLGATGLFLLGLTGFGVNFGLTEEFGLVVLVTFVGPEDF